MNVTEYIQKKEAIETTRQRAYRSESQTVRNELLAIAKQADKELSKFKLYVDRYGNKHIFEVKQKSQS